VADTTDANESAFESSTPNPVVYPDNIVSLDEAAIAQYLGDGASLATRLSVMSFPEPATEITICSSFLTTPILS